MSEDTATEIAQAKRCRAAIMGLLTKQSNNFKDKKATLSYAGLSVILKAIDDYASRFLDASQNILSLVTGNDREETNVQIKQDEFDESYFTLRVEILELMEEKKPKNDFNNSTVIVSEPHSSPNPPPAPPAKNVRLPKLELPKFSGNYHEWLDFKNEFESMIINDAFLSNVDRFRYLKAALDDKPRRIISNMEISDANFETAWEALKTRYDSKALIFRSHINEILHSQGVSGSSPTKLRELLDTFQSHYRSLKSLGSSRDIVENFMIVLLLSKLDSKAQAKWEEETDNDIPSWTDFIEHIGGLCKCSKCRHKHHELLHFVQEKPAQSAISSDNPTSSTHHALVAAQSVPDDHVLLASVVVHIKRSNGTYIPCNAVLDPGSTHSYITEHLSQLINAKKTKSNISICGIGSTLTSAKGQTVIEIASRFNNSKAFSLTTTILQKITELYPSCAFNVSNWSIPENFELADPRFNEPKQIDLLIGGGLFWSILTCDRFSLGPDLPFMYGTDFGWIVVGTNTHLKHSIHKALYATSQPTIENPSSLNKLVEKFWEIDNFETKVPKFNSDELLCENFYSQTTKRSSSGRYYVRLPFKKDPSELGESINIATRRFLTLERKLTKLPSVRQAYVNFIEEYKSLGHLEVLDKFDQNLPHYFLPHHCVHKEDSSSTKLRVVFDGSCATSSGISLNDALYSGPKLQNDLIITLLRFRLFEYVATADIQKMYRQVFMDPNDANFQLILWRSDPSQPLKVLRLLTVTYGTAPGAYLAIKTLFQLADDEEAEFPIGAKLLRTCFYVDDAMIGAHSITELQESLRQLTAILKKGCFKLSKFCSNSQEILKNIPPSDQEKFLTIDEHNIIKALGMIWQPDLDIFRFTWKGTEQPEVDTKRTVLSEIARLFDPLGLIAPVVTLAKIFFQSVCYWQEKLDWDTPLPTELSLEWRKYQLELVHLRKVSIPRYVFASRDIKFSQLHGFADASEKAYGICIYLRAFHFDGTVSVRLLTSKSRVAPKKVQTIARLELCAAKLLTEIINRLRTEVLHDTKIAKTYYWTDSKIVLDWLRVESNNWNIFVAHRVARIQELTEFSQWQHIPGEINPADLVSRGMLPSEIVDSKLWWNGPEILHEPIHEFTDAPEVSHSLEEIEEFRPRRRTLLAVDTSDISDSMHFSVGFRGIRRAFAYVLRFIKRCKSPVLSKEQRRAQLSDLKSIIPSSRPSLQEEFEAEEVFISVFQKTCFPKEFQLLFEGSQVQGNSPLKKLAPFIENNLIRVGGRIKKSNLPADTKNQIILPKRHRFTRALLEHFHKVEAFHAGPQTVLTAVRSRYWPIGGLQAVRSITSKCIWCFKMHPKLLSQLMGQLPSDRMIPKDFKPFIVSGVDFAGPFKVRHHARCRQLKEVHLSLFVCFITKLIHVELVPDRSTESFLRALKRFIADRGTVSKMYSDNASNFRGAARYLKELQENLIKDEQRIKDECNFLNFEWSFIPPRTPHQGGLWESSIKLLKRVMKNVVGIVELTQDELLTVSKQAAAIVNSRPITPLSADPNDLQPLTPMSFLYPGAAPPTAIIEPFIECDNINRLQLAKKMTFISQEIWKRFFREYLSTLQTRNKWYFKTKNVNVGDMVLVKQDHVDTLKWPIGRITAIKVDNEGLVRRATVRTATGEYDRGITQLALLPLNQ